MSLPSTWREEKQDSIGLPITGNGYSPEDHNPQTLFNETHQTSPKTHQGAGLVWESKFSKGDPYQAIRWERRTAKITKSDGQIVFEQKNVEVPDFWSQTATDIVASKYFRKPFGITEKESSARQMVDRVTNTISEWGWKDGYFATEQDYLNFRNDLKWLLINQYGAFNSPVWFNVGVYERPQSSACFILAVEDNMQSILDWYRDEGWIFKYGSGAGTNLSKLRSSKESLSRGGHSSGPVSFMKGADGIANSIRSGGETRRAAKMVVLNVDHPDIKDFIYCKKIIEDMTKALVRSGIKDSITADLFDPYALLPYQNANNSVRVTDEFMQAVENDGEWELKAVTTGEVLERVRAREVMCWIADAAWHSADPGMQYDTTINNWHTCPKAGRINASNPCSEYMHLDNSACIGPEVRISTKQGLLPIRDLYQRQLAGEKIYIKTELLSENAAVPRHGKRGYRPADVYERQLAFRPAIVIKTGRKLLYKIRLSTGQSIRLTADHRVLTEEGWKEVCQLQVDKDAIVTQKQPPLIDYSEASEEEIKYYQMLGWMLGDGYFSDKSKRPSFGLVFGPQDRWVAEYFHPTFNKLVNQYTLSPTKTVGISVGQNGVGQMGSTALGAFQYLATNDGFHPALAPEKQVPSTIFELPKVLQTSFLGALFSADGTIFIKKDDETRKFKPQMLVRLSSTSPQLLSDVQLMLFDFGIRSSISWTHPQGRKNPQANLSIYGHHAYKFCQTIGFPLSLEKQSKAKAVLKNPYQGNSFAGRRAVVRSITEDEIDEVYDISEPVTHSMIAEGMIIHNCNLASINLLKILQPDGTLNVDLYKKIIDTFILAQDILIDNSSFPTPKIAENARSFRELGLGYANLGALLMTLGVPYDSDQGRALAGLLTSILTGEGYRMSAEISKAGGPFRGYTIDREGMLGVIWKHLRAAEVLKENVDIANLIGDDYLKTEAVKVWKEAWELGEQYGYRNSQATVLAPTGTISFLMDCVTTGVEPELALVKYKKLVGGGTLKLVNSQVIAALKNLGYQEGEIEQINKYILERETIEGAPGLKEEHLSVFDCSFKAVNGQRSIHYSGHIKMMAATQPFISGAISKTVNLPKDATVEEIERAFFESWRAGLKAVAFYRDESKTIQPLNTSDKKDGLVEKINGHTRVKLPDTRPSITHKFSVGGHEGYLTVGLYPDTQKVGETFISIAKEGSTVSGLLDVVATLTSISLQSGVPLKVLVRKFKDMRFEPSGFTSSEEVPVAKSIIDYIFRFLGQRFLTDAEKEEVFGTIAPGLNNGYSVGPVATFVSASASQASVANVGPVAATEAMVCECGSIMVKAGSCYSCPNCFSTTGVCN